MSIGYRFLHHHKFCRTRNEDGQLILLMMICILGTVLFDETDVAKIFDHLGGVFYRHTNTLCDLRNRVRCSKLRECLKSECNLLFRKDTVKYPIFRVLIVQSLLDLLLHTVGNPGCKFDYHLFLFRILSLVVGIRPEVVLIDHGIAELPFLHGSGHSFLLLILSKNCQKAVPYWVYPLINIRQ